MSQEGHKDHQGQQPPEPLPVHPAIIQKARSVQVHQSWDRETEKQLLSQGHQTVKQPPLTLSGCCQHTDSTPTTLIMGIQIKSNQIKFIYIALRTSADISKCCTETQPKTPNSKQCRCRSTVARKNSLERPKPRKKPREEPGYVGWPVLFWLCRVEIITEHDQDVQMFINDQHGRIIIRQNS